MFYSNSNNVNIYISKHCNDRIELLKFKIKKIKIGALTVDGRNVVHTRNEQMEVLKDGYKYCTWKPGKSWH